MRPSQLYNLARDRFHRFALGRWDELTRLEMALIYPWWLLYLVFRDLIKDRALVQASSLAFTTVLSVVPVLTVATMLVGAFGSSESGVIAVLETLLPFETQAIVGHIQQFVTSQAGAISGIGAVVLIVLGASLFNNIERAFNDIWRISQRRPLVNKFLTFYALVTLGPLLITISIVQSARVQLVVEQVPFAAAVGYKLLPIGLGWIIFTLVNKLLPYTKVRWPPALVSGLVTAVAFEGAKFGFNFYVGFVLETYSKVYGAIGLIPIFLVWVYVSWVIVLFGAKLAYAIQNLRSLLVPARLRQLAQRRDREFSPLVSLDVFLPIAESFKRGEGPVRLEHIAAASGVPAELARNILNHLIDARITLELKRDGQDDNEASESLGFLPARPLGDIPLLELLQACRPEGESQHHPFVTTLRRLYLAREREVLGGLTCEALVSQSALEGLRAIASSLTVDLADAEKPRRRSDVFERIAVEADGVLSRIRGELEPAPEVKRPVGMREALEAELLAAKQEKEPPSE